jgi:hypothetical protein
MKKYLQSILLFDLTLPALLLGIPCSILFWAVMWLQSSEAAKEEEHSAYETISRQVETVSAELQPMQVKASLLKNLLYGEDMEAKLGTGISASLDKFPADEVEETLHEFQYGPSEIGPQFGDGLRLSLKLSSHWEALNTATAKWETHFPNLVLESLSIDLEPGLIGSPPYLRSALSYFVVTGN